MAHQHQLAVGLARHLGNELSLGILQHRHVPLAERIRIPRRVERDDVPRGRGQPEEARRLAVVRVLRREPLIRQQRPVVAEPAAVHVMVAVQRPRRDAGRCLLGRDRPQPGREHVAPHLVGHPRVVDVSEVDHVRLAPVGERVRDLIGHEARHRPRPWQPGSPVSDDHDPGVVADHHLLRRLRVERMVALGHTVEHGLADVDHPVDVRRPVAQRVQERLAGVDELGEALSVRGRRVLHALLAELRLDRALKDAVHRVASHKGNAGRRAPAR